jgi:hypothetical protein
LEPSGSTALSARLERGHAIRTALAAVVVSRSTVFLVGYLAVAIFGYANGRPPVRDFDSELANLPSRFDARWYLQIAEHGYAYDRQAPPDVQQNIVFFPAFPMAVRAAATIGGRSPLAFTIAGTVLSLAAFAFALVYLQALASAIGAGKAAGGEVADSAVWLLAFYPFSIFYGAIYTESFFLLAAVAACYHATREEDWRAAGWGLVAGLTRPNGFLLAAPLAILAARRLWSRADRGSRSNLTAIVAALAPLAGVALYSAYLWLRMGDPLLWERGHIAWGRSYQGLFALVVDRYRMIANGGLAGYLTALPHDALNALGALFAIATAWPVARTLGPEYALWMLLNILPPLAAGGLISAGRFSSVLFPSFIWLASAVAVRRRAVWVGVFAALQALAAAMFYTWRPLY